MNLSMLIILNIILNLLKMKKVQILILINLLDLEEPTLETFNKAVTDDIEVTSEIENEVVNEEPFLEETVENILEEITETAPIDNVQEDISTNFFENNTELTSITGDDSEQNNKIDELTNNFRKMLINLANEDSNVEDTSNLISNYFKEIHELADAEIKKENEITTKEIEENTYPPRRNTYIMKIQKKF